jgi:tRNA-dihydrouridine synthase 1
VKKALRIPVLANGNVRTLADAQRLMDETGADGVLSADPLLVNPALFRCASVS